MTKKFNLYIGKAGHPAIMSELLMRGWNVAIPEVDIGDDIFVVQDDNGTLQRVQVKTSFSTKRKGSYSAQFNIPLNQLKQTNLIPVHYVFIVRHENIWKDPLIITQDVLLEHIESDNVGSVYKNTVNLYFSFANEQVFCNSQNFSKYICDYSDFPVIEH